MRDQFGDPIKSLGTVRFEIFEYRPATSDARGKRFDPDGTQTVDLTDPAVNQRHWDTISRSYRLNLKLPQLPQQIGKIVLQATFTSPGGYRHGDTADIDI